MLLHITNEGEMILKRFGKSVVSSVLAVSILALPSISFAAGDPEIEKELLKEPANGVSVVVTTPELEQPQNGIAAATAAPYYRGQSKVYAIGGVSSFSDVFTDYTQVQTLSIDRVYVKSKQYINGIYTQSAVDDQKKASHAGIYVAYGARTIGDQEVLGEHKFEQTGYKVTILETTDT